MGKKELRKTHKQFDQSIIDYVSRLDKSKTNKLTGFLLNRLSENDGKHKLTIDSWSYEIFSPTNKLEYFLCTLMVDMLGGKENIELINTFGTHLEAGRITNNDISKYSSWDEIRCSVAEAELKYVDKEMKKQTKVIFEDDTWLIIKPLSLKASQIYGMGTKWCTSMKNEKSYFYNYSRRGILVYSINKKNGQKYGFFSSPDEFSVWDAVDKRIDSMETRIPSNIIDLIRVETDIHNVPVNEKLFSEETMEQVNEFYNEHKSMKIMDEQMVNMTFVHEQIPIDVNEWGLGEDPEEGIFEESMEEEYSPRGANTAFGGEIVGIPFGVSDTPMMTVNTTQEMMEAPAYTILDVATTVEETHQDESGNPEIGYETGGRN